MRHIVLVGLPGAGKSAVGRRLAAHLGTSITDIDAHIAEGEGTSIAALFTERGEAVFRALEQAAVRCALAASPHVIAPGGGWAAYGSNLDEAHMARAWIVFLKIDPAQAAARLGQAEDRPLLQGGDLVERLERLRVAREPFYVRADCTVDAASALETVAELLVREAARGAGWPYEPPLGSIPT